MTKEKTQQEIKSQIENGLLLLLRKAEKYGITIAVANDSEGNHFNSIKSESAFFGDTTDNAIAIGVWQDYLDEKELFGEKCGVCNVELTEKTSRQN